MQAGRLLGIAFVVALPVMLLKTTLWSAYLDARALEHGFARARAASEPVEPGELVMFEGTVEPPLANEWAQLPADFAMGFVERETRHRHTTRWDVVEAYRPLFQVRVPEWGVVSVDWPRPNGTSFKGFQGEPRVHALTAGLRAVGLAAGDRIACLATVDRRRPMLLLASRGGCYAGPLSEFRRAPWSNVRQMLWFFVALFAFLAACVVLVWLRRRRDVYRG